MAEKGMVEQEEEELGSSGMDPARHPLLLQWAAAVPL
jgi:hypothetical protein